MPEQFSAQSKLREVVSALGPRAVSLLLKHGYDVGEGFIDVLSQYQSLEDARRSGRIRNLDGLLSELNSAGAG